MNHDLSEAFKTTVLCATGASSLRVLGVIQELWSGYGKILRLELHGADVETVVVKHVTVPLAGNHPRGWNSDISHQRKVESYRVETNWYKDWNDRCGAGVRTPKFLAFDRVGDEVLLVLEDLDAAGFPARLNGLTTNQIENCLTWLANFHATFMGAKPGDLWEIGTYWHLDTRPDELEVLDDPALKNAAKAIDIKLNSAQFKTLVHGDAKLANFCFSENGDDVAMLDFQYVGDGCGMKDVAYFIGSCLDERACEARESPLLDAYFSSLRAALAIHHPDINPDEVEAEWRELFPVAWTDFHRFLKGWCPGHWKITGYSERLASQVIGRL